MKNYGLKSFGTAFGVLMLISSSVSAQLLGGASSAAAQAQAQAQQRVQAQAQQRAQAQAQQNAQTQVQAQTQQRVQAQAQQKALSQVQAQVQNRVQIEAARAANIAVQASVAAQQQATATAQSQAAAARQRAVGGLNVRLGADARVDSSNEVRVGNTRANANANAYSRLGIDTKLVLPPGITKADVQIYDNIFGRFNPLRAQAEATGTAVTSVSQSRTTAPESLAAPPENADPQESSDGPEGRRHNPNLLVQADGDASLTSRIGVAARQRRAEISQVRDQALAASDTGLMLRAQQMDDSLKAFVQAQAQASNNARAATQQPRPATPQPQTQTESQGGAQGNAQGSATLQN